MLAIICANNTHTEYRRLKLIVQDSNNYWVTVQNTDENSGIIVLNNGERHERTREEYLINNIQHLNYFIPLYRQRTQIVIRVYKKKPKAHPSIFGAIDINAAKMDKANNIGHGNLMQDNENGWVVRLDTIIGKPPVSSATIPDSNILLPVRVAVDKDGTIRLLTT